MSESSDARTLRSEYDVADLAGKLYPTALFTGAASLLLAFALGLPSGNGLKEFMHTYLLCYVFFLSISLGGLFFVAIGHLVKAGWNVVVRRPAELIAMNLVFCAVLALPILVSVLFGECSLYEWDQKAKVAGDLILQKKQIWLNDNFFTFRIVLYFAIWIGLAWFFWTKSVEQDQTGDHNLTTEMETVAPVAILAFALTTAFASFDLLMSLDPHWFSTIFGVYFFSGCAVSFFAFLIVLMVVLQSYGFLKEEVTVEHYHDLGKFMFGFIVFWAYTWFSQYMLIWYANMPEETGYYLARNDGVWWNFTMFLLFFHFVIPFLGVIWREVKRTKHVLAFWACWILVMHFADLVYLVKPRISTQFISLGWVDLFCFVGVGGLWLASLARLATGCLLLPIKDPRLGESLALKNV